ncbi:MAG: acetate--CoA ligase family protein [Rhizobiaceae bacterium]
MKTELSRFLRPKSVAYIGGAQIAGPIRATKRACYDGAIWVVNPSRDEIEGVRCFKSVADLPLPPDAAVVGLSPERAITAVAELAAAGAGGAVVMSSGFAELGTDVGRERQARLKAAAGAMPLLGPNCMGMINQFSGAAAWGDDNHIERQDGPAAAIISQSGALLIGMTNVEQAFPLGYAVSLGNQSVTTMADIVDAVLEDDRIRAIGLYIEGVDDGEAFGQACRRALTKGVPVIALKGGDGAEGSKVSLSHTASMVVERDIWEAFCARFGIVEVGSPKALVETLKLLTIGGIPEGNRVSIVSYSGGLNGLAATRANKTGIALPMPTAANAEFLSGLLPETVAINNPLDLNIPFSASDGSVSMKNTAGVADALTAFGDDVCDQMVFFIDVPRPGADGLDRVWCDSLEALIAVRRKLGVPVSVAGIMPEGLPVEFRRHMHANGVAALLGYAETMEALDVGIRLAEAHRQLADATPPEPLLRGGNEPSAPAMLNEAACKRALAAFGLEVPPFEIAEPAAAAAAAGRIGFPVAVKVLSSTIAHKARVGGVALNLNDAADVQTACAAMAKRVAGADGGHVVEQVLVERMIAGSDGEMIVGVKRHPAMGLALMVGRGGSRAEEMARFETTLLPLAEGALGAMFARLGVAEHPAAAKLDKACRAVAAYAEANRDRLVTLDVNPVMLTASGGAIAADALIVLGG